jgi:hypothetical protein
MKRRTVADLTNTAKGAPRGVSSDPAPARASRYDIAGFSDHSERDGGVHDRPEDLRGLGVVLAGMVGGAVVSPSSYDEALAQAVVGACRPVSERTSEAGCWILAHHSLG